MKYTFRPGDSIVVPDGTALQEILGPRTTHELGKALVPEVSTALGTLPANVKSSIHVHPIVVHLTYVLSGQLTVAMKDPENTDYYTIDLLPGETVLTRPCTLFQLINKTVAPCQALYIVAPCFVYETDASGTILYNDQIVLEGKSWSDLRQQKWVIPELADIDAIRAKRDESLKRLSSRLS
jgi:mannose-6-phosphate isomerase-like protein (cupin superfamily)